MDTCQAVGYTPDANWSGTDSFTYTLSDGYGGTTTATVAVSIAAVNDAPVAADDGTFTVLKDGTLAFDPRGNDTDADGDALTVTAVTQGAHGTVAHTATGITYTPDAGFTGTDAFTYTVSDGHGGTATATATANVVAPARVGGRVWDDTDHDGIQDAGETDHTGVVVRLLDASDNVVATASTDSAGLFLFTDLLPGQYRVRVLAPTGNLFTLPNRGTDDDVDSDVDGAGFSTRCTLSAGDAPDLDAGLFLRIGLK